MIGRQPKMTASVQGGHCIFPSLYPTSSPSPFLIWEYKDNTEVFWGRTVNQVDVHVGMAGNTGPHHHLSHLTVKLVLRAASGGKKICLTMGRESENHLTPDSDSPRTARIPGKLFFPLSLHKGVSVCAGFLVKIPNSAHKLNPESCWALVSVELSRGPWRAGSGLYFTHWGGGGGWGRFSRITHASCLLPGASTLISVTSDFVWFREQAVSCWLPKYRVVAGLQDN